MSQASMVGAALAGLVVMVVGVLLAVLTAAVFVSEDHHWWGWRLVGLSGGIGAWWVLGQGWRLIAWAAKVHPS